MLNKFILEGRLVTDPELKEASNCKYADLRVSCKRPYAKKSELFFLTAFDKNAEFICKYFKKDSYIALVGYLNQNVYEKDGKTVSRLQLHVTEADFVGYKTDDSQTTVSDHDNDDDLPF